MGKSENRGIRYDPEYALVLYEYTKFLLPEKMTKSEKKPDTYYCIVDDEWKI